MSRQLTLQTVQIIKQTAPVLQEHAEALTRLFYRRMFDHNPEVRPYFNPAHQRSGGQQRALAGALVAYATHIDRLSALGPAVELIAHKHASLGIRAEHYPIVGEHLLASIRELLGAAATDEIIAAWAEAYGFLADILIAREGQLYRQHEERHGWQGFRAFRVTQRVAESEEITSLHLAPSDGGEVGEHLPGQYLTLRAPAAGGGTTMRNYSISNAPSRTSFRISVKRERAAAEGAPDGRVSGHVHDELRVGDEVEVGPPCGEFVLDLTAASERPLVLLSGGVGVTPVLSMLHAAVAAELPREVYFIHAARNGRVHAFADEVADLAKRSARVHVHVCYDEADAEDRADQRCDSEGRIDLALLQRLLPGPDADFYFCGPRAFMSTVADALETWGVASDRIRYECFGPLQPLGVAPHA